MADDIVTYFNKAYDDTYNKIFKYVLIKCSKVNDVNDIIQEVYTEFYSVLLNKGSGYIENAEAFLMKVTKSKIYRHYSLLSKIKDVIPLTVKIKDDEIIEMDIEDKDIDEQYVNSFTVNEIWKIIDGKNDEIKKIFYLYYYCDMKLGEISEKLRLSQSNVKHKLYRTLEEIREIYKKDGENCERKGIL